MPSSPSSGKIVASGPRLIERVLDLQIADRMHRLRAADRLRSDLRQADGPHVAGLDQIGDGADGVLDRHAGIEARRAIDVDVIDAEARQAVREEVLHRCGTRVDAKPAAVRARAGRRTSPRAAPCRADPAARGRSAARCVPAP